MMLNSLNSIAWLPQVLPCPVARLVSTLCPTDVPNSVLRLLHPAEYVYVARFSGTPFREWVAGRHCLAEALSPYTSRVPLLARQSGAPTIPSGMAGSISHKGSMTVAVATREFDGIGVDLEYVDESDRALAAKVLTVEERSKLDQIGSSDRAAFVTAHFCLKEAIYKAARDEDQEGMEFQDIELGLTPSTFRKELAWNNVSVTIVNSKFESHGFIFRDSSWILAIATRSKFR